MGWESGSAVSVLMPDILLPLAPKDQAQVDTGAGVELLVTAWRKDASWIRGIIPSDAPTLLGQYLSISLYWHSSDGEDAKIKVSSLPTPIRFRMKARVPETTFAAQSGRRSRVAVCV